MNDPTEFWNWFSANNDKFFYLTQIGDKSLREKFLDELLERLHLYCEQLYFEIGGIPDKDQELIITADGNKNYFQFAESLVNQAPKLKDWKIIALKQPKEIGYISSYKEVTINPYKVWFKPFDNKNNPNLLGLQLYMEDYSPDKQNDFTNASYYALENILGERSCAEEIVLLGITQKMTLNEEKGLSKLTDLQAYMKWKKKTI